MFNVTSWRRILRTLREENLISGIVMVEVGQRRG